jgi:SAM-dependent methyltransferase
MDFLKKSLVAKLAVALVAVVIWQRWLSQVLRGHRWYTIVYRAFYLARLPIWERRKPPKDLIELVEGTDALPHGRALDLGCGTGTDSIYLAQHGWDVTGVDMVPEALVIARRNAATASVSANFFHGDVTCLRDIVEGTFDLLLDFGCFHTLPADQRPAYVESVSAVASPSATLLLYGFARPPRYAPMQAGVSLDEVRDRFAKNWQIDSAELTTADAIQVARTRADRGFELWRFRLRKLA